MPEDMALLSPVYSNRFANGCVVSICVGVNVTGVGKFAARCTVYAVNLLMSQSLECRQMQFVGESVDACMLQELLAAVCVHDSLRGPVGGFYREGVVACVLELKEATEGFDVFGGEFNAALQNRSSQ